MTTENLMAEHRKLNKNYTGSPIAPLPRHPEGDAKTWIELECVECGELFAMYRKEHFWCPNCGQRLVLKGGDVRSELGLEEKK